MISSLRIPLIALTSPVSIDPKDTDAEGNEAEGLY